MENQNWNEESQQKLKTNWKWRGASVIVRNKLVGTAGRFELEGVRWWIAIREKGEHSRKEANFATDERKSREEILLEILV